MSIDDRETGPFDGAPPGPAAARERSRLNVAAIALGNVVAAIGGLLTIPHIIRELGAPTYGVWAIITVVAAYLTLLELGVTAACGRMIASRRSSGDILAINVLFSNAFVLLFAVSFAIVALSYASYLSIDRLFDIPEPLAPAARDTVFLMGLSVLAYFVLSPFNCVLWSHERFDLMNLIDIVVQIGRAAYVLLFIDEQSSLIELAFVTLAGHIFAGCAAAVASWIVEPRLRFSWALIGFDHARSILRMALRFCALNSARNISNLVGMTVVGLRMDPSAVTSYSIARQLITYGNGFCSALIQVAAARSVVLFAKSESRRMRRMFFEGGVYATAGALLLVGGFVLLGDPFIALWQMGRHPEAYVLLAILALGELVPISQLVTNGLIMGMNRLGILTLLALGEVIVAAVAAWIAIGAYGLIGAALAVAFSAFIFRGVLHIWFGGALLRVSVRRYLLRIAAPLCVASACALLAIHALGWPMQIGTWGGFLLVGTAYTAAFVAFAAAIMFQLRRRRIRT